VVHNTNQETSKIISTAEEQSRAWCAKLAEKVLASFPRKIWDMINEELCFDMQGDIDILRPDDGPEDDNRFPYVYGHFEAPHYVRPAFMVTKFTQEVTATFYKNLNLEVFSSEIHNILHTDIGIWAQTSELVIISVGSRSRLNIPGHLVTDAY
jgi:hypothetical protein